MTTTIVLSPEQSATQALDVIVRASGDHVIRHAQALRAGRDPQSLHQVRVGVRRARAAFSLLRRPLGDGEKLAWVSTEMRDLAVPLGRARDLDVVVRDHGERLTGSPRDRLLKQQADAYDEVLLVVTSDRWHDLGTHIDGLLRRLHEEVPVDPPVLAAAGDALDRRFRRVTRRGATLASGSRRERHALRIETKKLRYGVQFFGSLYAVPPGSATEAGSAPLGFATTVAHLQDVLGELRDIETSRHLLELVHAPPPDVDEAPVVERAVAALTEVATLTPFWRDRVR